MTDSENWMKEREECGELPPNLRSSDLLCVMSPVFQAGTDIERTVGQVRLAHSGEVLFTTGALSHAAALKCCREWAEANVVRWRVRLDDGGEIKRAMPLDYYRRLISTMLRGSDLPCDEEAVEKIVTILRAVAKLGRIPD